MTSQPRAYLIRKKPRPFRGHSTNSSGGVGTSKGGPETTGPQVNTPKKSPKVKHK